jgi:hypothetical protein
MSSQLFNQTDRGVGSLNVREGPFNNESLTALDHDKLGLMIFNDRNEVVDLRVGAGQALSLIPLVALQSLQSIANIVKSNVPVVLLFGPCWSSAACS